MADQPVPSGEEQLRLGREHFESATDFTLAVEEELGAAEYLSVPSANASERQIARFEEGATLEEIYAEQVRPKEAAVGG